MALEDLIKRKDSFTGNENWTKDEMELFLELEEEFARRGNFQRVFPLESNVQHYEKFFEVKRY